MTDKNAMSDDHTQDTIFPLLPLRDVVVFPHMVIPLFVGRKKSIQALERAMESGKHILLVTQKDAGDEDPTPEHIYEVGTIANILQLLKFRTAQSKCWLKARSVPPFCVIPKLTIATWRKRPRS